jgi:ubiquinone/menaquinone biosynthesis C-methylase UbiE
MNESEFDKFADEYQKLHAANIRLSGETPDYFARYKVEDVARLLGPDRHNDLRILDFGSGVGTSVPHFRELLPASRMTCLDVSTRSLDIGRARYSGQAEFLCFDGKKIPFPDNTFDLSFAACVLHHIDHDEHPGILHEWLRVLRPGGYGVIFEHNALNPLTRQAVSNCPFDEHAVLVKAGDLVRGMRDAGFRDVSHRYRIFFPRMLRRLRVLEPCLSWLPLGAQYCIVGRK